MNRFLSFGIIALLLMIGAFAGHEWRESQAAPLTSSDSKESPFPATGSEAAHDSDREAEAALGRAYSAFFEYTYLPVQPGVFDAIEKLNLSQVREMHARFKVMRRNDSIRWILECLAHRWARLDPSHAAEYARKFSPGPKVYDYTGLLAAFAHLSPEAALAEAEKSPGSAKSVALRREALTTLASRDPTTALARLDLVKDEKERTDLLQTCLETWAATDTREAARWILENANRYNVGTEGNSALSEGVGSIALYNLPLAIETTQKLGEPLRSQALSKVLWEWVWRDAGVGLEWCRNNGVGLDEQRSLVSLGLNRAQDKTIEWLLTLPPGEDRDTLMTSAISGARVDNAEKLFPLLSENGKAATVNRYIELLGSKRNGAAYKFATGLPEGDLRERALFYMLSHFDYDDPEAFFKVLPAGRSRDAAASGMLKKMVDKEPALAATKLFHISDADLRQRAAVAIFREWRHRDQSAAEQWLASTADISADLKPRLKNPEPQR